MELHNAILDVLKGHVGKENRISRRLLLRRVWGEVDILVSDRDMRQGIEELRRDHPIGALICSSSGSGGYWLAESYGEVLASYQEERRRAMSTMFTQRQRLDAARKYFGGQLEMQI